MTQRLHSKWINEGGVHIVSLLASLPRFGAANYHVTHFPEVSALIIVL